MTINYPNQAMIDVLSGTFQKRDEAQFSLSQALPTYLTGSGLVAFWSMASIDAANNGDVLDLSGNQKTLANINTTTAGYDGLMPYTRFVSASTQRLTRADEASISILGTEPYIDTKGLTVSLWAKFDSLGNQESLVSKYNAAGVNERSWLILKRTVDTIRFFVSGDGTAGTLISADATLPIADAKWHHIVCRFTPSTEIVVFLDGQKGVPNTTSVPAQLHNSVADLFISGRRPTVTPAIDLFDGKISMCGLYASALPDYQIINFYHIARILAQTGA